MLDLQIETRPQNLWRTVSLRPVPPGEVVGLACCASKQAVNPQETGSPAHNKDRAQRGAKLAVECPLRGMDQG